MREERGGGGGGRGGEGGEGRGGEGRGGEGRGGEGRGGEGRDDYSIDLYHYDVMVVKGGTKWRKWCLLLCFHVNFKHESIKTCMFPCKFSIQCLLLPPITSQWSRVNRIFIVDYASSRTLLRGKGNVLK